MAADRTLYLVACAASPLRRVAELIALLRADAWAVRVIATPTAATWSFLDEFEPLWRSPLPAEPWPVGTPDAVLVAPATFNTINKWATGVNDNLAVGVLNEALGAGTPIVAAVHVKPELAAHPAFAGHLRLLREAGVRLEELRHPYDWRSVVSVLRETRAD